jgi:dynein heavy chain
MYVYLETIFSNPDFKKELSEFKRENQDPNEKRDFQAKNDVQNFEMVNIRYKKLSRDIIKEWGKAIPRSSPKIKKFIIEFKEINEKITVINRNINEFLDKKRNDIYRLHFISNDEMIVLLANADKVETVQQYISKLFENVNKLQFNARDTETSFDAVISREGEVMKFGIYYLIKDREKMESINKGVTPLSIADKPISEWLLETEKLISETLSKQIDYAIKDIVDQDIRDEFYLNHNAQAISVVSQYYWTMNTALSIQETEQDPESMWSWYKEIISNLERLTQLVRSGLKGYRHTIICSVVTSEVHNRDIVLDLYEKGVASVEDFAWEQQLRYEQIDASGSNTR